MTKTVKQRKKKTEKQKTRAGKVPEPAAIAVKDIEEDEWLKVAELFAEQQALTEIGGQIRTLQMQTNIHGRRTRELTDALGLPEGKHFNFDFKKKTVSWEEGG